jgi:hypothetical protein
MSTILDALEGVLTDAEQQALMGQLIGLRPAGVAPGDLITAELFNDVRNDINALMLRVAALEGAGGGPVITTIQPKGVDITINSLLTVLGTGFNKIPEYNTVMLGGKQITNFNEASSQSALIFPVPDLFTGLPKTVDLTVTNDGKTSNAFPVPLKAHPREQHGEFLVTEAYLPTGTLSANSDEKFGWDVLASTTLGDSLTLSLVVSNADPAASTAQWQAAAATGFAPPSPVAINPGQTRRVDLSIHTPAGAKAADLQLKVVGIDGTTQKSSPIVPWRAGQSLDPSNPNTTVSATQVGNANAVLISNMQTSSGSSYPQGFTFKAGKTTQIAFEIVDKRGAGTPAAAYTCSAALVTSGGDWTISNAIGDNQPSIPAGQDFTYAINIANKAGAVGTEYLLRVEAKQTKSGSGVTPYTSFAMFPIKLSA